LYVSTYTTVTAYNATTGTVDSSFTSPAGLTEAEGLAVSGTNLYVTDFANNTVGDYSTVTGDAYAGFVPPTGLDEPLGIAVSGNYLYISNYDTNTLIDYDLATDEDVAGFSSPDGSGIPEYLAVTAVPEPRAWPLCIGGLLLLWATRMLRRRIKTE
jgi:hypothetical protein